MQGPHGSRLQLRYASPKKAIFQRRYMPALPFAPKSTHAIQMKSAEKRLWDMYQLTV